MMETNIKKVKQENQLKVFLLLFLYIVIISSIGWQKIKYFWNNFFKGKHVLFLNVNSLLVMKIIKNS